MIPIEYFTLATVIASFATAMVGLYRGVKNGKNIQQIHISLDGELKELKKLIASSSHAEGVIEGRANEKANPS